MLMLAIVGRQQHVRQCDAGRHYWAIDATAQVSDGRNLASRNLQVLLMSSAGRAPVSSCFSVCASASRISQ